MSLYDPKPRLKLFVVIVLATITGLGMRLAKLQLIDTKEYTGESRNNAVREKRVTPARGVIYDRNGILMVDNEPTYTIMLTPRYFDEDQIPLLASLVNVEDSVVVQKLAEARDWSPFQPSAAFANVTLDIVSRVEENRYLLPGVTYETTQRRRYLTDGHLGHGLGYIREISRSELERRRADGYRPGDLIGIAGLEKMYEPYLRGETGSEFKLVNIHGREVKPYRDGEEDQHPVSGYDLHLTLDSEVQALAESLFVGKRGSLVAIEPASGEILAFVSKPDIDPRIFSGRVTGEEWSALINTPEDPLFNRATMSGFPPGSTWKPFMALVGLQKGLITENTVYRCRGGYRLGNRVFKDHNGKVHGPITVKRALQESCNSFFFNLMMQLDVDEFHKWGTTFGFGNTVDFDIAEQDAGLMPDSAYYNRVYPRGWTAGYSINLGIGQGDMLVTPLQLARYTAAIANYGNMKAPHMVRSIQHSETGEIVDLDLPADHQIPVERSNFEIVREGMKMVMEHGSGRWAQIPNIDSGGKTGTAQAPGDRDDHSLFVMFAPFDDPKIALAVMVENGGFGATQAAPIATVVAEYYLTRTLTPTGKWRKDQVMTLESQPLEESQ